MDFIIEIQEQYINGYKLGHWIYKLSENNKVSENIFNTTFDENWTKFLGNIQILLSKLYEEYRKKFESKEYIEILHEQTTTVNEIREECFADAIAYAMIFSCQTAHCGRSKPHFDFGDNTSPTVPYRHLPQPLRGMTADCRSFV